jgi:hypothetical protein
LPRFSSFTQIAKSIFALQVFINSKARHDFVNALAREMDGLAERRKRAPDVNDPDLAEEPHDLRVDAIAAVGDNDDAGSRRGLRPRESLAADAQKQCGEAISEELEGLVVKRDAYDVLESDLDRVRARSEDGLTVYPRFRLEGIPGVEDTAANIGCGNGLSSAA